MNEKRRKKSRDDRTGRKIALRVVHRDPERCLIDAASDDTVAFRGDAVDAPTLCCGECGAALVVAVDRRRLTNMVIECKRCGSFNDTRDQNDAASSNGSGGSM